MLLLSPVDTPGLLMRVVYRVARRRYGKVLMPLRVIYSRAPDQLPAWRSSTAFSPRERAALAWVDDILEEGRIAEATLADARKAFSERELVELTWLQASEAYFNLQAHPLGIRSDELAKARRTTNR